MFVRRMFRGDEVYAAKQEGTRPGFASYWSIHLWYVRLGGMLSSSTLHFVKWVALVAHLAVVSFGARRLKSIAQMSSLPSSYVLGLLSSPWFLLHCFLGEENDSFSDVTLPGRVWGNCQHRTLDLVFFQRFVERPPRPP